MQPCEFLGNLHLFDEKDNMVIRRPSPEHRTLIENWKLPEDAVSLGYLRELLGSLGFHAELIPKFSHRTWYIRQKLNTAVRNSKKKVMTDEKLKLAFHDLKTAAASAYCYNLPSTRDHKPQDVVIHVFLDASYIATGAMLTYELVNDPERKGRLFVVAFSSRTFPIEMVKNSSSDIIEYTAFCNMVQSFYPVFFGKFQVRVWSDSKNLISLANRVRKADLSRGSLSVMFKLSHIIEEWTADVQIKHISGCRNVADAISRIFLGDGPDPRRPAVEEFRFSNPQLDKAKYSDYKRFPFLQNPEADNSKNEPEKFEASQEKVRDDVNFLVNHFSDDSASNEVEYLSNLKQPENSDCVVFAARSIMSKSLNNLDDTRIEKEDKTQLDESLITNILDFHKQMSHKKAHLLKESYEQQRNNGKPVPLHLFKLAVARCATCLSLPEIFRSPQFKFYNLHSYLPNSLVAVDAGQFLKASPSGFDSFLVFTCTFSMFSIVYPIKTNSAREYLRCLRLYIQHFGAPFSLKLDNHPAYGSIFQSYCDNRRIRIFKTTPTIHSGNSRVESRIRLVKRHLAANLAEYDQSSSYHNPYQAKSQYGDWSVLLSESFSFSNNIRKKFTADDETEIASPNEIFLSRSLRSTHVEPQCVKSFSNIPVKVRCDVIFKAKIYESVERHKPVQQPKFKAGDLCVRKNPSNIRSRKAWRIDEIFRVVSVDGNHVSIKEILSADDKRLLIVCHASQISQIFEEQLADWSRSNYDFSRLARSFRKNVN